mgnify:CR=1 FL=1
MNIKTAKAYKSLLRKKLSYIKPKKMEEYIVTSTHGLAAVSMPGKDTRNKRLNIILD